MKKPLLIFLTVILVLPNFLDRDIQERVDYNGKEKFSPQLSYINSIDKLEKFVDAKAADKNIAIGSVGYIEILEHTVSYRFYRGFSHKTLQQDWITSLADKIAGTDYSCLVLPEEIMLYPKAACSQQAIVMMEVLKRKKINYREIGFPHHFAMEANIDGGWYYMDANLEPDIAGEQRLHQNWQGRADSLKKYYSPSVHQNLSYGFGTGLMAEVNKTNEEQAPNLKKLQAITGVMSKIAFLFPLGMLFALARRRPFKLYALKPLGKYVRMQPLHPVFNA